MKFSLVTATLIALIGVSGCAEDRFVGRPGLTVVQQGALPEPLATDLVSASRPQVLGPFDQLSVDVFGLPEFSRTVTIDRSGNISLPLAGEIPAAGKTPTQLAQAVTQSLRANYVRDPRVTINVTQVVSQVLTVSGQVRQPGLYPVTGRMTLLRAIARAQGVSDVAREDLVLVFRRVNGRDTVGLYDLRAIQQGIYADPEVFANDVVQVDASRARRLFNLAIASSGLIAGPLIAILN
ncbi:polysaccharide export outer membrane protein [Sphingomonas palmae]|uniref:Polysaccharide export outer membrane protein n=1 Tax=Sphingomonas palmae TaxID=1855283 RepID=A0A1H7UZD9_9SPHN|nr:polysaccharide biosynthesis/export family protein [Sphingomonas palmae]SEM02025.1 polysaccharide export outer membrane protein [Sphingomonas palmae]